MNGERIESVWDLLSAQIRALEARVEVLEAEVGIGDEANTETAYDYMAEHDGWLEPTGGGWIGGTD